MLKFRSICQVHKVTNKLESQNWSCRFVCYVHLNTWTCTNLAFVEFLDCFQVACQSALSPHVFVEEWSSTLMIKGWKQVCMDPSRVYSMCRTYGLAFQSSCKGNQTKSFLGNSKVTASRELLGVRSEWKLLICFGRWRSAAASAHWTKGF